MNNEVNKIEKIFIENKSELPLILHQTKVKKKEIITSGKIIEILKYRTKLFPIDNYYKNIIRIIE